MAVNAAILEKPVVYHDDPDDPELGAKLIARAQAMIPILRARADADDRNVAGLQAAAGNEIVDHHVGAGTRRAHAHLQALQVLRPLVVRGLGRDDADADLRRGAREHEGRPLRLADVDADRRSSQRRIAAFSTDCPRTPRSLPTHRSSYRIYSKG